MRKEKKEYRLFKVKESKHFESNHYVSFYPYFGNFTITYSPWFYFDVRPMIHIHLTTLLAVVGFITWAFIGLNVWAWLLVISFFAGWGDLYIHLPFWWKNYDADSEYPQYGIYLYRGSGEKGLFDQIVICRGEKSNKYIAMPWHYEWYRTSRLMKDNIWFHETKAERKKWKFIKGHFDFYDDIKKQILWQFQYEYTYTLRSGVIQKAMVTVTVSEREWRPLWFMWTGLFKKVNRAIDVDFDKEIGEEAGSWKGGVMGCSYNILKNENPVDTLLRMEKERKFERGHRRENEPYFITVHTDTYRVGDIITIGNQETKILKIYPRSRWRLFLRWCANIFGMGKSVRINQLKVIIILKQQ